jgi:hypothetical protein
MLDFVTGIGQAQWLQLLLSITAKRARFSPLERNI